MKYRVTIIYEFDAPGDGDAVSHLESALEALEEADFEPPTTTLVERHTGWTEITRREH